MFGEGTKREAIAVTLSNEALRLGLGEEGEESRGVLQILRDNVAERRVRQGSVTLEETMERRGHDMRSCVRRKHQGVRSRGELLVLMFLQGFLV
jgi:hypothetical protein